MGFEPGILSKGNHTEKETPQCHLRGNDNIPWLLIADLFHRCFELPLHPAGDLEIRKIKDAHRDGKAAGKTTF